MAYTTYPSEARSFSAKSQLIKEKLNETEQGLNDINSIFKLDVNEDYLTLKTIEATLDLVEMVSAGKSIVETESVLVSNKANSLEQEAQRLAEASKDTEEEGV